VSTLSDRLKLARERKNLSQIDVMKLTNINNKTISGYENEVSKPDVETLKVLAALYSVTTDYLISGKPCPSVIIHRAGNMNLNDEQKEALEKYKKMPADEQHRRLQEGLDKLKSLPVADQEALLRIIDSIPSARQ
jgi:transcriptional regulator with XRE-family HTH domain